MVGQQRLVAKLKSYTITTLPHALMLLGESGCGKHTLAQELAEYFNLELADITDSITQEFLSELRLKAVPGMYLVSIADITEKEQNMLLKFVEEPGPYAYVVLLGESTYNVLETLLNRCIQYTFDNYSKDDLRTFMGDNKVNIDELYSVCTTPGQIRLIVNYYDKLNTLCTDFASKLNRAPFSNVMLNIADMINYKDTYDKFDLDLFLKVLKRNLSKEYTTTLDKRTYVLYNILVDETSKLIDKRLNKQLFAEHLLTVMWRAARKDY